MKELDYDVVLECVPEMMFRSQGVILPSLPVFKDHFPEFPVVPGVLALEILKRGIENCLGIRRNRLRLIRADHVRFQHFLRPGETWECQVTRMTPPSEGRSTWSGTLKVQTRRAVSAQLLVDQTY